MRALAVISPAVLVVCVGAAAPSPAPSVPPAKPLRHLEYAFSVHEEGVSEYHFNGIGGGTQPSSGVGGAAANLGGRGTMYADVLSIAPDGALVVRISEWVQGEPRARQAYTCTVYGDTAVLCPPAPAPSDAEWVLLGYLGRSFVDAAPWDAKNHWQRTVKAPEFTTVEDFTMTDGAQKERTLIHEHKKTELHNGAFGTVSEDIDISYDRTMEVPTSIHDQLQDVEESGSGHATFDFQLTADSFAKPAGSGS